MTKKSVLYIIIFIGICVGIYYLLPFSNLVIPNQPCRPIKYPDGSEYRATFTPDISTTTDSLTEIATFYNQKLNPELGDENLSFIGDHNVWTVQEIPGEGFIYRCGGVEFDGVLARGCIYVYEDNGRNVIEMILYQSSEALQNCRNTLQI